MSFCRHIDIPHIQNYCTINILVYRKKIDIVISINYYFEDMTRLEFDNMTSPKIILQFDVVRMPPPGDKIRKGVQAVFLEDF